MTSTGTTFRNFLRTILILIQLLILDGCRSVSSIPDGSYCANIERYNPKTQRQSSYTLTVEIKDGKLVQINYPNGGHMDTDDMPATIISSNKASFSDYNGVQFEVEVIKKGNDCFSSTNGGTQCTAITKKGKRCKNRMSDNKGLCHMHIEVLQEKEGQYKDYVLKAMRSRISENCQDRIKYARIALDIKIDGHPVSLLLSCFDQEKDIIEQGYLILKKASSNHAEVLESMAIQLFDRKFYTSAIEFHSRALEEFEKKGFSRKFWSLAQISESFLRLHNYKSAKRYIVESRVNLNHTYRDKLDLDYYMIQINRIESEIEFALGNDAIACEHAFNSHELMMLLGEGMYSDGDKSYVELALKKCKEKRF